MSFQVDTALVNSYRSGLELALQQKGSRLRQYVRVEPQNAEFDFHDRIGTTEAVEVENRHSDTPLISTPHDRRRVGLRDFDWADMIDRKDRLRMLSDPTSPYTVNAVYALGRKMDRILVDAAFGTSFTGKEGGTSVTFPASQSIAANYVETGSAAASNLSIGKLRRIRTMLDLEEAVDYDAGEDLTMAVTAHQIQSLLAQTEVTSSDFNGIKALVHGEVDTFLGIKFVRLHPSLLPKSGNNRSCLAFARQGLLLALAEDVVVDIGPRRDKRNSTQIYVCASFAASRMWEEKVIKVLCDETVV